MGEDSESIPVPSDFQNSSSYPTFPLGSTTAKPESKTASSILLEERRKLKRKMEEINEADFSDVSANLPKRNRGDPSVSDMYMDQIATSNVENPKYWNVAKKPSGQNSAVLPAGHRKTTEKKSKGEDYNDRFQAKLQSRKGKLKLKSKLKK